MMLEAVWYKNGKKVYQISPVLNIMCGNNTENISEIEVKTWDSWHSCSSFNGEADDFIVRIKVD